MRLLIASDIHGSVPHFEQLVTRIEEENPDRIILLGDILYHGPRNDLFEGYGPKGILDVINEYSERIIAVRGNCDSEVDQMVLDFPLMGDYSTFCDEHGHLLFLTHGHIWGPDHLPELPPQSAFLYGHTHRKQAEICNGIALINPGSVSLPRDGSHSYASYENECFSLKALEDGSIITHCSFES
ncbi:MAG: phosphodiesterase [Raoultibacter sp.]|jgi:putative phosphoesterase